MANPLTRVMMENIARKALTTEKNSLFKESVGKLKSEEEQLLVKVIRRNEKIESATQTGISVKTLPIGGVMTLNELANQGCKGNRK